MEEKNIQNEEKILTKRQRKLLKKQEMAEKRALEIKKQSQKKLTLWLIIIILIVGSIFAINILAKHQPNQNNITSVDTILPDDHIKGSPDAEKVLVEYSDFQCPACKQYYPILKQVANELGDKVQIIYRNFPLKSIHKNATLAARAAEAAAIQNKFWEMHDQLFEGQNSWSNERNPVNTFITYAERLGLNIEQFKKDLNSDVVKNKVNKDYTSGARANIPGTPTFFLNGKALQTPRSYAEFKNILN